jgi:hypothetical protein
MFHKVRNVFPSETEILHDLLDQLEARLPRLWTLKLEREELGARRVLSFLGPDGSRGALSVQAKNLLIPKMVQTLADEQVAGTPLPLMVVAPFLSPETRTQLASKGISYADATGNIRITLASPAVYFEKQGESRNPWREDRPLGSLKGPAAGRVVRALCDFRPPYGIRELAQKAGLAPGTVSRTVEFLDGEGMVREGTSHRVNSVDWAALIPRWTQDFDFLKVDTVAQYLEPRGIPALLEHLRGWSDDYAVTASLSAATKVQGIPARLAIVYVIDHVAAAKELGLTRVGSGGNVLLVEPRNELPFERRRTEEGVVYAALSQTLADLQTAPGRGMSEAEALADWMARHEDEWRA